jgi:DNA-binding transcriptional MerR regulator
LTLSLGQASGWTCIGPGLEDALTYLTIGQFAERTRLSPKALRIYGELGLVLPARVDPGSGYRLYAPDQIERARLVALLRRLDMPLATIAEVIDLDPPRAARAVSGWWSEVHAATTQRQELIDYLLARLSGRENVMYDIAHREIPQRTVVSISRHLRAAEVDAFFGDAFARLRATGAGLTGIAGCPYLIFYGEISDDSDGPLELCRPVDLPPADLNGHLAADLQVRVDPAHDEAYIRLAGKDAGWPAMLPACDALERWRADNDREPAGALRQVLIADQRSAMPHTLVLDLTVPLRRSGRAP